ncbi:DUF3826 domain-containing protein [Chitinophaga japonensis]|uniref:Uncharacterized protein DUF3826 n=1 Tax=Chitinophaga japonensis TaxID=104662 RepID=A0A562T5K5_CHIJA|nr:DUF3826 domain-containing protein [Chitinophaga japonensis]TWI88280.1 uncharacterized protein DUF3826 [Chitinophaga japonensis]
MKRFLYLFLSGWLLAAAPAQAQTSADADAEYTRVITRRADKIVTPLELKDKDKALQVRDIIVAQYRYLNEVHTARDTQIKAAKAELKEDKDALEVRRKAIEEAAERKLDERHQEYLARLSAKLTPQQVDQVKDGMTYGVAPLTYRVYNEILPNLTEQQKKQIKDWLEEAREHAMDAGSSKKKHWWFGKYKGRINNYLSAAGYNMKEEEKKWKEREKI